ncbi:hypothetical protein [[Mycobacterium] wendilense]|uniref:Uncharacterized protein n=1 Tax=[Mycobacterium] wendilense TaxID=3064284 RepID=A0ABM9MK70_9MYCO|nr:hypothetical protein [Mycolicibacterium sp. MU0050]CAJ1587225.1 hypothetical protein MU0050_004683 [Mycolicibacterium sp. MU0050]
MRQLRYAVVALFGVVALATGCSSTAGTPVAEKAGTATAETATSAPSTTSPSTTPQAAPAGDPVGTAVLAVRGSGAPVTIRYRINGGPEQTETNVVLPWEKQYDVYWELDSEVSADGGDAELICTIIFNGDQLVSFVSEPRPTCTFAYWG